MQNEADVSMSEKVLKHVNLQQRRGEHENVSGCGGWCATCASEGDAERVALVQLSAGCASGCYFFSFLNEFWDADLVSACRRCPERCLRTCNGVPVIRGMLKQRTASGGLGQ